MSERSKWRVWSFRMGLCLAWLILAAAPALAQRNSNNVDTKRVSTQSITLAWNGGSASGYNIYYITPQGQEVYAGHTYSTQFMLAGLSHHTRYRIRVEGDNGPYNTLLVRTRGSLRRPESKPPVIEAPVPQETCPHLPSDIVVTGYQATTQCQVVGAAGVGRMDLIERGVIRALDVWGFVNGGVEVCFRNFGALVFLDAAYAPRMLMDLASFQRDGMTCGAIDRAGTVVLLQSGAAPAQPAQTTTTEAPASEASSATLPTFDAIPANGCLIKLVETLFLRESPGGAIIGLVWLNSEVPVFEVDGHWYKIEFEGKVGYISRFYRKVLRGGCG